MIVGMDFGTTNSGMAYYDGAQVRLLPIDPLNPNPRVARSALYITNDQTVSIARDAVNRYFEQNLARPVRMERVWVGEIEMVYAELPIWIEDVYAWVDVLSPGRLFLSFKTGLREPDYTGTVVANSFMPLEDLLATYLYATRLRAERALGRALTEIVLGRPVRFSTDPQHDRLAQQRLVEAAFRAGYERVYIEYEPIAAAYHYALSVDRDENILVFDFGGGTLDITVMRLGREERTVLATGGLPIAGDVFDQKLLRAKLTRHFGEHTAYGPRATPLPVPTWIYDTLADWQSIVTLQTPDRLAMLREIERTAHERRKISALIDLVSGNYGLRMFEVVERAKRRLSQAPDTEIKLIGGRFNIRQPVTRVEFETIIGAEIHAVERLIDDTVARSGLAPRQIDAVIRTGGSSEIPVFQRMLAQKFGADRVHSIDVFSSVTSGLGIIAHGIAHGDIQARAYTRDGRAPVGSTLGRANVAQLNLDLLQRRIALQEEAAAARDAVSPDAPISSLSLIRLGDRRLTALPDDLPVDAAPAPTPWPPIADVSTPTTVLAATGAEPILAVTSKYRLFLVTADALHALQSGGYSRADLPDFEADEVVCAIARWRDVRDHTRLVLVTTRGVARSLNMALTRPGIEGPRPLKIDWPAAHWPAVVLGAEPTDHLLVATDTGRAARLPVSALAVQGSTVVRVSRARDERVAAALAVNARAILLLATTDGYLSRHRAPDIARADGQAPVDTRLTRRAVAALSIDPAATPLWLATTARLIPLGADRIPTPDAAPPRKPHVALTPGETVVTLVDVPTHPDHQPEPILASPRVR